MPFPTYPTIPDPWPDRAQGQPAFDSSVSGTFTFLGQLRDWSSDWGEFAENLEAALVAGNLPDLTGQAGKAVVVNSTSNGVSFSSAPLSTFSGDRNKIINGLFDVWQRGTSFTISNNSGQYTADRWYMHAGAGATCQISRVTHVPGVAIPNSPQFYYRFARSVAGTGASYVEQRIEGVRTLAGRKITVTFWTLCTGPINGVNVHVGQDFGTGGSPSGSEMIHLTQPSGINLASGLQKVTLDYTVPSVSGKTIGTNGDDYLFVRVTRPHSQVGALESMGLSNFSVVDGDARQEDDPGAWRHRSTEELMCSRYFYRISDGQIGTGERSATSASTIWEAWESSFPIAMRISPTTTIVVAPTYVNCSNIDVQAGRKTATGRVETSGSARYRAFGGTYDFNAEL